MLNADPQPQKACSLVWALPISLAATFGIDVSFFSSGYLDVSVPRVPSAQTMYSSVSNWSSTSWVSPFGYHGIYACLRLPHAFRSLPRPSSALGALASALCSCSLDFLENDLSIIVDPETNCLIYFSGKLLPIFLATGLQRLFSRLSSICAVVKVHAGAIPASRAKLWWGGAVDSNHRPLAYQASALTS